MYLQERPSVNFWWPTSVNMEPLDLFSLHCTTSNDTFSIQLIFCHFFSHLYPNSCWWVIFPSLVLAIVMLPSQKRDGEAGKKLWCIHWKNSKMHCCCDLIESRFNGSSIALICSFFIVIDMVVRKRGCAYKDPLILFVLSHRPYLFAEDFLLDGQQSSELKYFVCKLWQFSVGRRWECFAL